MEDEQKQLEGAVRKDVVLLDAEELTLPESSNKVDKGVGNNVRLLSRRTQYNVRDFNPEHVNDSSATPKRVGIKVQMPRSKKVSEVACNTEVSFHPQDYVCWYLPPIKIAAAEFDESFDEEIKDNLDDSFVLSEEPVEEDDETSSKDEREFESNVIEEGANFIVSWVCLSTLLCFCSKCFSPAKIRKTVLHGTSLIVYLVCSLKHDTQWSSQTYIKKVNVGSLLLSTSILFSGNTFQSISEMMSIENIAFFSKQTFCKM